MSEEKKPTLENLVAPEKKDGFRTQPKPTKEEFVKAVMERLGQLEELVLNFIHRANEEFNKMEGVRTGFAYLFDGLIAQSTAMAELMEEKNLVSSTEMTTKVRKIINDLEVKKELESDKRSGIEKVDRTSTDQDVVCVNFHGLLDGRKDFNGGSGRKVYFDLKNTQTVIEGFRTQLIGLKADDMKAFDTVFPDDYPVKELAGKTVNFTVKCVSVKQRIKNEEKTETL